MRGPGSCGAPPTRRSWPPPADGWTKVVMTGCLSECAAQLAPWNNAQMQHGRRPALGTKHRVPCTSLHSRPTSLIQHHSASNWQVGNQWLLTCVTSMASGWCGMSLSGVHSKAFFSGCLRKCNEMCCEMFPARRAPACTTDEGLAQCVYATTAAGMHTREPSSCNAAAWQRRPVPETICTQLPQQGHRDPAPAALTTGWQKWDISWPPSCSHTPATDGTPRLLVSLLAFAAGFLCRQPCRLPPDIAAPVTAYAR